MRVGPTERRAVPNFFVVGAPKAGTTSLYHYLDQHPEVYVSPIKEPCFFAPEVVELTPRARDIFDADAAALQAYLDGPVREKRTRGFVLEWEQYLKLFKNVRGETAVGEASVSYLSSSRAPGAIRERAPDGRIIMMLRDPVDRLFSHYVATYAAGATDHAFVPWVMEQVAEEATRRMPFGPVRAGRYAEHLQRYYQHFSRQQVCVHLYDDYLKAPGTVLRDVLAFLGVDPDGPVDVRQRHNVTLVPRWPLLDRRPIRTVKRAIRACRPERIAARARAWSRVPRRLGAGAGVRARLMDIYEEDIRALERLIDRDLAAWRDPNQSGVSQPLERPGRL